MRITLLPSWHAAFKHLCGLELSSEHSHKCRCVLTQVSWSSKDGDRVLSGQQFGTVRGMASSILVAERVALNFMQVSRPHDGYLQASLLAES